MKYITTKVYVCDNDEESYITLPLGSFALLQSRPHLLTDKGIEKKKEFDYVIKPSYMLQLPDHLHITKEDYDRIIDILDEELAEDDHELRTL